MAKNGLSVFDSDLHVFEPADLYQKYLDEFYRHRAPSNGIVATLPSGEFELQAQVMDGYLFGRQMRSEPGTHKVSLMDTWHHRKRLQEYAAQNFDAVSQVRAMDVEGIDVAVLFRTRPMVCVDAFEPEFAIALCRAWNDWMTDFRQLDPKRMRGAALLTLHDPALATQELRRCVEELGMVAVQMIPNPVNGRHVHDPAFDMLWAEAERLGVPIGFHPAPLNYSQDHFVNRFQSRPSPTITSSLNNPVELMSAIASMTVGGVLERFPQLRVAFLEGNCSWLPWLLWRLDEYWEMSKDGEEVQLQATPSEYFRRQCFISVDPDEDQVAWVIQKLGDDNIVFSSDYPHHDTRFPHATEMLLSLDISDSSKRKILWDNCARLYGLS